MTLHHQVARGLKWQAIEIAGRQVLSLVVFTTLARLLDPGAFGLVGLVAVYLAFVGMFAEQGLGTALIQRKDLEPRHINAAFWFNIGCAGLLCAGTIAAAPVVARLFAEPRLEPLLRWASLSLVMSASVAVQGALFRRGMDFRRPMLRTLVANLAGGAIGIGMAMAGYGVWALIGQQLTAAAAGAAFLWIASPWRPSFSFSFTHLRELMAVSASVFATGLLWFFSSRLDQIVIGRFAGAGMLGQYVVGGKLAEFARMAVHQPVAAVSMPALSRLQHDYARMRTAIYKGMELNALVSFAIFGGLAAVAPTLVPLAFGEQWLPAVPMLQLLAIYQLVVGIFVYCHPALLASGGPGRYVLVNLACAAGAAVACLIGIQFGVAYVVLGLILNLSLIGMLALFFLRQRIGLHPWLYLRPCILPAIAGAAMFASVMVVRLSMGGVDPGWDALLCQVVSGACTYTVLILAMAPKALNRLRETAMQALTPGSETVGTVIP